MVTFMIRLTRLSGSPFVLNSDLIERIDTTPDTVITLADGTNYVAAESADEVVHAIRMHRATIIALSETVRVSVPEPEPEPFERPGLATVTDFPAATYGGLTHEGAEA
jgi:flagellar protein FlbD